MLRVALSISQGKIRSYTILRKLGTESPKSRLHLAFRASRFLAGPDAPRINGTDHVSPPPTYDTPAFAPSPDGQFPGCALPQISTTLKSPLSAALTT